MRFQQSLIKSVIFLAVLFAASYFAACDISESVAVNPALPCETNNTAELTIWNNSDVVYNIYLDNVYLYSIQKNMSKQQTITAGVNHVITFKTTNDVVKCSINKKLDKCTEGSIACDN